MGKRGLWKTPKGQNYSVPGEKLQTDQTIFNGRIQGGGLSNGNPSQENKRLPFSTGTLERTWEDPPFENRGVWSEPFTVLITGMEDFPLRTAGN